MKISNTVPMARAACEGCSFSEPARRPEYSERVAEVRESAIRHARQFGHDVFVEKSTGSLYKGSSK